MGDYFRMGRHTPRRIELGLLLLGWMIGLGTNLVTSSQAFRSWWPLEVIADSAGWWLPLLVAGVIGYEFARRYIRRRTHLWRSAESPYAGLPAYTKARSAVFFGRDAETQECLSWLESGSMLPNLRVMLLVGQSGAGKSSLLFAGVIPRLSRRWAVLEPLQPGGDPFVALAKAFTGGDVETAVSLGRRAAVLRDEALGVSVGSVPAPTALLLELRHARARHPRVLVVIDQAEELKLGQTDSTGLLLWNYLQAAVLADRNVYLALTVRADSFRELQDSSVIGPLAPVPLGAMAPAQIRQAVIGPAKAAGVVFEAGLVDTIVAEATIGDALPLVSQLLQHMWHDRDGVITVEQYRRAGRVDGSIAEHANNIYRRCLDGFGVELVHATLLQLVDWNGHELIRRWTVLGGLSPRQQSVIAELRHARLVIDADGGYRIGLVHDALLRRWSTLRDIAENVREPLRRRVHLESAAVTWSDGGRHPDGLLRGQILAEATHIRELLGTTDLLNDLIERSASHESRGSSAQAAEVAAWAQQTRTADWHGAVSAVKAAAQQLDSSPRGPATMTLWGLTAQPALERLHLGHLAPVTSMAWSGDHLVTSDQSGVVCWWSQRGKLQDLQAVEGATRTRLSPDGSMLAVTSVGGEAVWRTQPLSQVASRRVELSDPPRTGYSFSNDGRQIARIDDWSMAVYACPNQDSVTLRAEYEVEFNPSVLWSPDGQRIAVVSGEKLSIGPVDDYHPQVAIAASAKIGNAAWSPDGRYIAAVTEILPGIEKNRRAATTIEIWDAATGQAVQQIKLHRLNGIQDVGGLAWSPHNTDVLAVAVSKKSGIEVLTFHVGENQPVQRIRLTTEQSGFFGDGRVAWSPKVNVLALSHHSGIFLVDVTAKCAEKIAWFGLRGNDSTAWQPGAVKIAEATKAGARVFDLTTGTESVMSPAFNHELGATSVAWASDRRHLAAANFYGFAVWNDAGELMVKKREGLKEGISRISWSYDGKYIVRSTNGWSFPGTELSIWDSLTWHPAMIFTDTYRTGPVGWSPDGLHVALCSSGTRVSIVSTTSWSPVVEAEIAGSIISLEWSSDSSKLAVSTHTGTIVLMQPLTLAPVITWIGPPSAPKALTWSPDGSMLAAATPEHLIYLWSPTQAVPLAVIEPDGAPTTFVHVIAPNDTDMWIVNLSWATQDQLQAITRCGRRMTWRLPISVDELVASLNQELTPVPETAKQRFALR